MDTIAQINQLQARHGIITEIATSIDRRELIQLFTCLSRKGNHTRYELVPVKFDQVAPAQYVHNKLASSNHELIAECTLDLLSVLSLEIFAHMAWKHPRIVIESGHDMHAIGVLAELREVGLLDLYRNNRELRKSWLYPIAERIVHDHRTTQRSPEGQRIVRYLDRMYAK